MLQARVNAHVIENTLSLVHIKVLEEAVGSKILAEWLVRHLQAHLSKTKFDANLASIQSIDNDNPDDLDCPIYCDHFGLSVMFFCAADHVFCKTCLNQCVTTTLKSGSLSNI